LRFRGCVEWTGVAGRGGSEEAAATAAAAAAMARLWAEEDMGRAA